MSTHSMPAFSSSTYTSPTTIDKDSSDVVYDAWAPQTETEREPAQLLSLSIENSKPDSITCSATTIEPSRTTANNVQKCAQSTQPTHINHCQKASEIAHLPRLVHGEKNGICAQDCHSFPLANDPGDYCPDMSSYDPIVMRPSLSTGSVSSINSFTSPACLAPSHWFDS